jgi:site-specific DNA-methyltransferase (adenine-specific)
MTNSTFASYQAARMARSSLKEPSSGVVHIGDCVQFLSHMASEIFDLVVADPPYNIGVDYGGGPKADRRSDYDLWCHNWIQECYRVLKPSGSIWIISGQEYAAYVDLAMQRCGFTIRNRITWHETFGVYCHGKFGRCSRPIFYGTKSKRSFTFNREAVLVPSARQTKYRDRRARPGGKIMGDVWQINRVCGTFSERVPGVPTQLPVELVSRILSVSSNPGDLVLDPFAGSGTTLVCASRLGRSSVGIELNPEYAEIASRRVQRELPVAQRQD